MYLITQSLLGETACSDVSFNWFPKLCSNNIQSIIIFHEFHSSFYNSESESNQVKDPKAESTLDTIQLTWVKPEGEVTGYRVVCQPKGGERSDVKLDGGDETSHELAGLVAGREHEMEIYTVNGEKESEKVTIKKFTSKFYNDNKNNIILFL